MNSSPATAPEKQRPNAIVQRLLIVWLPILVVAALIFWLSGGMPPAVLRLLLQMLSHWHSLQATLGAEIFLPFAIVLVQCLFLFAAWVILALTIWREVSVLHTLQAQQRIMNTLNRHMQQDHQHSGPRARTSALRLPLPLVSTRAEANNAPGSQALDNVETAKDIHMVPAEVDSILLEEEEAPVPENTAIHFGDENDDMFDAKSAIFELKAEPEEPEVAITGPAHLDTKEEMVFVYGNPFDGELPEIFHYDMDLKREVEDLHNDAQQQSQEREKQHIGHTAED